MSKTETQSPLPATVDPVLVEVTRNYLVATCREMGQAMMRTAYSTMFNEAMDFSCAIFDASGEMVAQGEFCPAHLGAMVHTVEWCIKEVDPQTLEPGDIVLHNDPYRGGCHLPEHLILRPVFSEHGAIVAYCATIAHMVDVGGSVPGAFGVQRNVFEDGLRLPPVKLYRRDEEQEDIVRIIISNIRQPGDGYGDLCAMVGSVRLGERRLHHLIARHGVDTFLTCCREIKDVSERLMRRAIGGLSAGVFPFSGVLEDDGIVPGKEWRIAGKLVIKNDHIIVDYGDSSPASPSSINQSFGCTASATYNAVFHLVGEQIPANHGAYRPIHIIAPPGSVVNGTYPSSVTAGNSDTHPTTIDIVLSALSRVTGRGSAADGGTVGLMGFRGIDPRSHHEFVYVHQEGMGWGARHDHDGNDSQIVKNGNCLNTPVELYETRYPFFINEYALAIGSPGAGAFRGGYGTVRTWTALADMTVSVHSNRHVVRPWGMFGGGEGANTTLLFRRAGQGKWQTAIELFGSVSLGKFSNAELRKGDQIRLIMPGGGGWGEPLERDTELVRHDVEEGLLDRADAEATYGVVISASGDIDHDATVALRRTRKDSR